MTSSILPFESHLPSCGVDVWIAPGAFVIGEVTLHDQVSVWYGSVVRGDVVPIVVGARTNIQDMTMIHGSTGGDPVHVGQDVTIGHRATLHGCRVGDGCLIGMGAIILDGAVVGEGSLVAAGSVVTPGTIIPPRSFVIGTPARVKREVSEQEVASFLESAAHYVLMAARHGRSLSRVHGTD